MKFFRSICLLAGFALLRLQADFPEVDSVTPNYGVSGAHIAIIGQGFTTAGVPRVYFGGGLQSASIVNLFDTVIEVIVPPQATIGPIIVQNNDGSSQSPSDFLAGPYISSFERLNPPPFNDDDKHRGNPGDEVLVSGLNFESNDGTSIGTKVYFGNVQAFTDPRGSQAVSAIVPANAVTGPVIVITTAGGFTTGTQYFYITPNIATFVNKAIVGGQINLTGTSFLGVTNVSIGGISAPTFVIQGGTGTNIVLTIPATAPLSGPISVTSGGNTFTTSANFLLLPSVTSFSVAGGAPGASITLNGYGLAGATNVFFGGIAAVPTATTANTVTVAVPNSAVTGPLRVSTPNGTYVTTNSFYVAPIVSGFSPSQAIVGAQVTVTGINFTGATAVSFGGTNAPAFNVLNSTSLVVNVPNNAKTGPISVTGPGGTGSSAVSFSVLGTQPYISTFAPTYGAPGSTVTITGLNLATANAVSFNGTPAANYTAVSATKLTAIVPAGATTGPIAVTNPSGTGTSGSDFVVGTNADLTLQMTVNPLAPVTDSDMTVNFTIRNQGPLPATAAKGNFTGASITTLSDTTSTVGNSDIIGKTAVFNLGDIAPGSSVSGTIKLHVNTNGIFTLSMTASSDTPDPNTANNTVSQNLQSSAIKLNISNASESSIHIGWPIVSSYILEKTALLTPASWVTVTNSPDSDGSQYFLNLSVTNASGFYRLRKP